MRKAFTAERIEQLRQLSRAPDIYDRLARALGTKYCLPFLLCDLLKCKLFSLSYQLLASMKMMTSRKGFCSNCLVVRGRIFRTRVAGNSELRSTFSSVETLAPASLNCYRCSSSVSFPCSPFQPHSNVLVPVCAQSDASWPVHFREGVECCRSDSICHQGP